MRRCLRIIILDGISLCTAPRIDTVCIDCFIKIFKGLICVSISLPCMRYKFFLEICFCFLRKCFFQITFCVRCICFFRIFYQCKIPFFLRQQFIVSTCRLILVIQCTLLAVKCSVCILIRNKICMRRLSVYFCSRNIFVPFFSGKYRCFIGNVNTDRVGSIFFSACCKITRNIRIARFQSFDLIAFQRSHFRMAAYGADTAADRCSGCVFCNHCKIRCFSGLQIACRNFQADGRFQLIHDPQGCLCTFFFHLHRLRLQHIFRMLCSGSGNFRLSHL